MDAPIGKGHSKVGVLEEIHKKLFVRPKERYTSKHVEKACFCSSSHNEYVQAIWLVKTLWRIMKDTNKIIQGQAFNPT